MSEGNKNALTIAREHKAWVDERRPMWRAHRAAFKDEFWKNAKNANIADDGSGRIGRDYERGLLVEVNHVRPWHDSYVDSLFHKRIRAMVQPLPVQPDATSPPNPEALAALLDSWINSADIADVAEQAFSLELMYGGAAFKLGIDEGAKTPTSKVWMEAVPPWEVVYDRSSRTVRAMRYIGHLYEESREEILRRFPDVAPEQLKPKAKRDVLAGEANDKGDKSYVEILEFYDLVGEWVGQDDEGNELRTTGCFSVWIVDGADRAPLFEGPLPNTPYLNGRQAPPIIPIALVHVPENALEAIPIARTIYANNAEINWSRTFMANAVRKDAARKILCRKDASGTDVFKTAILSGVDLDVAEYEGSEPWDFVVKYMDPPPLAPSVMQYPAMLEADREATAGMSPTSRGQPLKYATAEEVATLNQYTETTLGRLRKRMDRVIVAVFHLLLRVLRDIERAAFPVLVDGAFVPVDPAWFDLPWQIDLSDSAAMPLAEQKRRMEFAQIQPMLLALAQQAELPGLTGAMAKAQLAYLIDLYDLPPDFNLKSLMSKAAAPAPVLPMPGAEPPPGPAPSLPGGLDAAALPPL